LDCGRPFTATKNSNSMSNCHRSDFAMARPFAQYHEGKESR
jgi:hypothetical protein